MKMKRLFLLSGLLGLALAAWAAPEVPIVPKPLSVETADGTFTVDAATVVTAGTSFTASADFPEAVGPAM